MDIFWICTLGDLLKILQLNKLINILLGGENTQHTSMTTETSQNNLQNLDDDEEEGTGMQAYTPQQPSDEDMEADTDDAQSSLSKQVQDEAMEFEPCLQVGNLQMSAANNITGANITEVPSMEQGNLQLGQVAQASDVLTSEAAELRVVTTTAPLIAPTSDSVVQTPGSMQSVQGSSKLIMVNPMSKPLFDEETAASSQTQTPKAKASRQDSLVLIDAASSPKGDDQVFSVLLNNLSPASSCFSHPSVLNKKINLDVRRCRNTFCDCRLYHCPLCTCLPNKPGRIREHFKKIHAQDLVIRYQGKRETDSYIHVIYRGPMWSGFYPVSVAFMDMVLSI